VIRVVIPTELKAAKALAERVLRLVKQQAYGEDAQFAIKLAMEEALVNAIKHGSRNVAAAQVVVEYDVDALRAIIQITDQGVGFDPASLPDPRAQENLECPCGRGILLMRAYMDEVTYNEAGNSVRMVKHKR
jgi:serine/threonine-protein kinase RsbW